MGGPGPSASGLTGVRVEIHNLDVWSDSVESSSAALANGGTVELTARGNAPRAITVYGLPQPLAMHEIEQLYFFPLSQLVTLCLMSYSPPSKIDVYSKADGTWINVPAPFLSEAATAPAPSSADALLYLDDIGLPGVAAWLDSCQRLAPLQTIVAATVTSQGEQVSIANSLLELTTIAEGLYRKIVDEPDPPVTPADADRIRGIVTRALTDAGESEEHVDAAQRKLSGLSSRGYQEGVRALLDKRGGPTLPATGNGDEWAKAVTKYRNIFAHARGEAIHSANYMPYVAIAISLRWFLVSALLQETGVSVAVLRERLEAHPDYQWLLERAPGFFPKVYAQ